MRRSNLNLLYALHAVLHAPSLTQAGRDLSLSQPAMSLALRRLREQFGDELVIYGAGPPLLTTLALKLKPRVAEALRQLGHLFSLDAEFDPPTSSRTLTLCAPEAIEIMYLSRLVPALLLDAPHLDIRVEPFDVSDHRDLFDRGVDVVVLPGHRLGEQYSRAPLLSHSLACLVRAGHPNIDGAMTVEAYLAGRHVALEEPTINETSGDDPMQALLGRRQVTVTMRRYAALSTLLEKTDLIATLSSWLAQYLAASGELRAMPPPVPAREEIVFAQWERHRDSDPMIQWLIAHMKAAGERAMPKDWLRL